MRLVVNIVLLAAFSSSAAFAGIFEYPIRYYASSSDVGECLRERDAVGAKFNETSGAQIVNISCKAADAADLPTMTIVYTADQKVKIWDSETESILHDSATATFSSLSQCESSRTQEIQVMTSLTGLVPFISKCYLTSKLSAPGFRHRILAVGESSWKRRDAFTLIFEKLVYPQSFFTGMESKANELNLKMTHWSQISNAGFPGITAQFYADYSNEDFFPSLNHVLSGEIENPGSCVSAVTSMRSRVAVASLAHIDCFQLPGRSSAKLGAFWWSTTIENREIFKFTKLSDQYPSISICEANAAAIRSKLENEASFIGAVCTKQNQGGGWNIEMLVVK